MDQRRDAERSLELLIPSWYRRTRVAGSKWRGGEGGEERRCLEKRKSAGPSEAEEGGGEGGGTEGAKVPPSPPLLALSAVEAA